MRLSAGEAVMALRANLTFAGAYMSSDVPRGQRGRVAPGGTSEGAAFLKNVKIYVKMVRFTVKR